MFNFKFELDENDANNCVSKCLLMIYSYRTWSAFFSYQQHFIGNFGKMLEKLTLQLLCSKMRIVTLHHYFDSTASS